MKVLAILVGGLLAACSGNTPATIAPLTPGPTSTPTPTSISVSPSPTQPAATGSPTPSSSAGANSPWHELPAVANVQSGTASADADRSDGADALTISCLDGGYVVLSIVWGSTVLGDHQFPEVETTIGTMAPVTRPWPTMASTFVTYYSADSAETVAFVKSLFGQTTLTARLSLPGGGSKTALFDITGTEAAVASVRQTCQW